LNLFRDNALARRDLSRRHGQPLLPALGFRLGRGAGAGRGAHQPHRLAGPVHRHIHQLAPQLLIARPEHPRPQTLHQRCCPGCGAPSAPPPDRGRQEGITHKTNGAAPKPARWPSSPALRACSTSLANKAETGTFHARICQHFQMLLHNCGRVLLCPTSQGLAQLSSAQLVPSMGGLGLGQAPHGQANDS